MDDLKDILKRPWIDPQKTNVRSFAEEWKQNTEVLSDLEMTSKKLKREAIDKLEMSQDEVDKLENELKIDNLTDVMDKDWSSYVVGNYFQSPQNLSLKCVEAQLEHSSRCEVDSRYRVALERSLRYRNDKFMINMTSKRKSRYNEECLDIMETMLVVQIFCPHHSSHYEGEGKKHQATLLPDQELLCYGSQSLTALKDMIICKMDVNMPGDCSDDPNNFERPIGSEMYSSSFFFIDNCFYNDMRKITNMDYSEVIRSWASRTDRGIGKLTHAKMEECCFDDLNFRLGQPYLYVHQGDCEHMVIFTDIRLFSPQGDCPLKATYPLLLKTRHRVSTSCFMCKLKTAKWMVFGNDRLPDEPFLFCQECMLQFNYTKDGQKIGQFSAYSFLDESALL